jgi:hypothetical protein
MFGFTEKGEDNPCGEPRQWSIAIADRLPLAGYLVVAVSPANGRLAVLVGPLTSDPTRRRQVTEHYHSDKQTCPSEQGPVETPAVDSDVTHDVAIIDYWWPFRGYKGNMDDPWNFMWDKQLRPAQAALSAELTFLDSGPHGYQYTATAQISIERCPDQNLAHNCAMRGMPDLPG